MNGAGDARPDPHTIGRWLSSADCLADAATVQAALDAMATDITRDLGQALPLVLCVARGGIVLAGHLLTRLAFPLDFDYVHVTRYGHGTTGGTLDWRVLPALPVAGRDLLLVDDILDEGATLLGLVDWCRRQGAASVRTAVLVDKVHGRKAAPELAADYTGLRLPDRFVFGFGMDIHGYWRNAPGIYALPAAATEDGA